MSSRKSKINRLKRMVVNSDPRRSETAHDELMRRQAMSEIEGLELDSARLDRLEAERKKREGR